VQAEAKKREAKEATQIKEQAAVHSIKYCLSPISLISKSKIFNV
jgi:hypothetical protein